MVVSGAPEQLDLAEIKGVSVYDDYEWRSVGTPSRHATDTAYVTIRKRTMNLSPGFLSEAKARERGFTHVIFRVCNKRHALEVRFLTPRGRTILVAKNPPTTGIFELSRDGGRSKDAEGNPIDVSKRSLSNIQCESLFTETGWLKAIAEQQPINKKARLRYLATPTSRDAVWIVNFTPSFEHEMPIGTPPPMQIKGIYLFANQLDEVIYYGQGDIYNEWRRYKDEMRRHGATKFRYSEVHDDQARIAAERHHIAEFEREFGRKPSQNRYAGTSVRSSKV